MSDITEIDRKTRILDAAEHVFADFGFEGASLRHIVLDAGVNLATVYYYFNSKEGLMEAVLQRRFGPLREEHLQLMQQFQREAQGAPLGLDKILEVMLHPPLRLAVTAAANNPAVMRLIGRIVTDPNPKTQEIVRAQYQEVKALLVAALRETLPALPLPDLQWRLECVWGALAFILSNPANIKEKTGGVCDPLETTKVLAQLITFFAAGFHAPAANDIPTSPNQKASIL